MSFLMKNWSAFDSKMADDYLITKGCASEESKVLLGDILSEITKSGMAKVLDLGCGNGNLLGYFLQRQLNIQYTGIDFSDSLLHAAIQKFPEHQFLKEDVQVLKTLSERYDLAIYSHVVETLESPEASLTRVSRLVNKIIIRFFEPPEFEMDSVELKTMPVTEDNKEVFYLRRKMSKDYYRLILSKIGCRQVDIYRCIQSKDQIHLLHL